MLNVVEKKQSMDIMSDGYYFLSVDYRQPLGKVIFEESYKKGEGMNHKDI